MDRLIFQLHIVSLCLMLFLRNAKIYSIHLREEGVLINSTFRLWIVEFNVNVSISVLSIFLFFSFFFFFFCIRYWDETESLITLWEILVSLRRTSLFPTFISWLTKDSGKSSAKKDMARLLLPLCSNLLLQKFSVYLKSQVCVMELLE